MFKLSGERWVFPSVNTEVIDMAAQSTAAPTATQPLSRQQISDFSRDGYLVIETPLIPPAEIKWCRDTIMRLLEGGAGRCQGRNLDLAQREGGGETISPSILQPSMYARELRALSYRKTALAIARQLLGPKAEFAGDHAIFKPRFRGHPTPWHQDEAFREPGFEFDEISIWIALTDSTTENGAMMYVPGSHLLGVLPHRLHGGAAKANTIECCGEFDGAKGVVHPIRAGAMIIHHGRTIHGALGNKTGSSRLAYSLQYTTPVKLRKTLRDAPWLDDLRSSERRERKVYMLKGGALSELLRILRSDRNSHRHFFSYFWRRRVNELRRRWHRKSPRNP
jgi:hypothetical protein